MSGDLVSLQRHYLKLRQQKEAMEARLRETSKQVTETEKILAEQMAANGQNHTMIDGVRLTIRVTPRISRAKGVDVDDLKEALVLTDFEYLVKETINAKALESAMCEVIAEDGILPAELQRLLRVYNQTVIAVTKS